ncbi:tetratricopeptide repeat protein [Peribacillus sp. NPDC097295]|uniref:tetratricopeptide repeat protein n=1 Tax=Peribacillus sp. NPDC097295 TaxID=3364402 RepID=UPI00381308E2
MNHELIMPVEMSIKEKKKLSKGKVLQAVVFSRCTMIEVESSLNENYYLIYYKNTLVYGEKVDKVIKNSFIDKIRKMGMVFHSDHPFLSAIIPSETATIPNKNKLFSQLQNQYSLQEVAYIATTLDSFFTKKQLTNVIYKIFYHYRRNGNYMQAFQIIKILNNFDPDLNSAREIKNSLEFYSYMEFYKSSALSAIHQKDPLYVEWYCFKNRFQPDEGKMLVDLLKQQDSCLDIVILWMEKIQNGSNVTSVETYTNMALPFTSMENWIVTLDYLHINPFQALPQTKTMIDNMLLEERYETAALYLLNFLNALPETYEEILHTLWGHLDTTFIADHLDTFLVVIQQLVLKEGEEQSEQRLLQLIGKLLETYDLKEVHDKLLPIQPSAPHSPVFQKINRMLTLLDDPDQMMELGQYYAEFKRYDDAIECFSWEMELYPDDPTPVSQLSKMYQNKGMVKEAFAYHQIYASLK